MGEGRIFTLLYTDDMILMAEGKKEMKRLEDYQTVRQKGFRSECGKDKDHSRGRGREEKENKMKMERKSD